MPPDHPRDDISASQPAALPALLAAPEPAKRRPRWRIIAGTAFIVATILGITAITLWQLRLNAQANAEAGITKLDRVLAEQTEREFQGVELVVSGIAEELKAEGINSSQELRRRKMGPEVHLALQQKLAGLPQADVLSLISAEGDVLNFSRFYPVPPINVADRDYFIALRDHPELTSFISAPVQNRATGTYTIFLARRIAAPDGAFIGIVLGAIGLEYFADFYRDVNPGEGGSIALWRTDGILLVRDPAVADTVGRPFMASPFFESLVASNQESGLTHITGGIQGGQRIVAARRLREFPLIASVGLAQDAILAPWRSQAMVLGAGGVIATIAVALVTLLLLRQTATDELMTRQRAQIDFETEARQRLEVALESEKAALRELRASQERERELERQLLHSQKLDALGTLAGGMAHDLNNALMPILALSKLVMEDMREGSSARDDLETIVQSSERARDLVQRILAFSRKQEMAKGKVDLAVVTREALRMLRPTLPATVELVERIDAVPPLLGDPGQLQQVIVNLVANAMQAIGNRGGTITIAVSSAAERPPSAGGEGEAAAIRLSVTDTGCGMDEATLNRVFEPFFTTKNVGEGTGLGLSVAHGIVAGHGGRIVVRSVPGAGTEFTVLLPACDEDEVVFPADHAAV